MKFLGRYKVKSSPCEEQPREGGGSVGRGAPDGHVDSMTAARLRCRLSRVPGPGLHGTQRSVPRHSGVTLLTSVAPPVGIRRKCRDRAASRARVANTATPGLGSSPLAELRQAKSANKGVGGGWSARVATTVIARDPQGRKRVRVRVPWSRPGKGTPVWSECKQGNQRRQEAQQKLTQNKYGRASARRQKCGTHTSIPQPSHGAHPRDATHVPSQAGCCRGCCSVCGGHEGSIDHANSCGTFRNGKPIQYAIRTITRGYAVQHGETRFYMQ
eukprot:365817-Chlamydomonas_euryale.AAC.4